MAKLFYSSEEVQEKLGITPQQTGCGDFHLVAVFDEVGQAGEHGIRLPGLFNVTQQRSHARFPCLLVQPALQFQPVFRRMNTPAFF